VSVELIDELEAGELSVEFEGEEPEDVIEWALERFSPRIGISTAFQRDGIALIDMAYQIDPNVQVFSVDTVNLTLLEPHPIYVSEMTGKHGEHLYYEAVEKRMLCCNVRKVMPLTRHLATLDAWITSLRRDQWATRTNIRKVEIDHDHGAIVKLNPFAEWTEEETRAYSDERGLPTNPLYDKGYTSIGCDPCTRALKPGEESRAGRWWWESNAPKECGIHCAVETGGLEHELHAIIGEKHH
jgi:phosphoadenosine phosphosulfate reductase